VRNYCARAIWKKLSISVVGVNKKLRRLSSVGSAILIIEEEATSDDGLKFWHLIPKLLFEVTGQIDLPVVNSPVVNSPV
jgi:hypothetical protein